MYQTSAMTSTPHNVVLGTNILISAILFGGKPREILTLVQTNSLTAYTSPVLLAELSEILTKKFKFSSEMIMLTGELIRATFHIVNPDASIHVVSDEDDNRVLEAAIAGKCGTIITGDSDLLRLKDYHGIRICTPTIFLDLYNK